MRTASVASITRPVSDRSIAALADDIDQPTGSAPRAEEPEGHAGLGERRPRRTHPEVTCQGEFDAAASGRPVDGRDHGPVVACECVGDGLPLSGERPSQLRVETVDRFEVGTCTERLARPFETDDRRGRGLDGGPEFLQRAGSECVPSSGTIQRHNQYVAVASGSNRAHTSSDVSKGLCPSRR